ncbi:MAG: VOC family protein [Lachnospiraceae bacterium]
MIAIRHTGIYVSDLELMKEFYSAVLGMKEKIHEIESSDYIATILGLNNAKIELYKLEADNGTMIELLKVCDMESKIKDETSVWEQGSYHIAVSVLNIDHEYSRLKKMGIKFISKPLVSPNGYAKVCFCKDPEGNFIELVETL